MNNNVVEPSAVDVLVPTKPIKGYGKFDCGFKSVDGNPDYKFQLAEVENLVLFKTELRGKEFRIPGFEFTAQVKCSVVYDLFTLYIRFIDPPNKGKPINLRMNPFITIVIINDARNSSNRSPDEKLGCVFPYNIDLIYGTFYPFCTLSYSEQLSKVINFYRKNSLTLHLYVRYVFSVGLTFPDDGFLWKADVSNEKGRDRPFKNEVQLAMSPMLCVAHDEVKVQMRLFYKDYNCYVEVRYSSVWNAPDHKMLLTLVNPHDSTERIVIPFELVHSKEHSLRSFSKKYSKILLLAPIEKLFSYTGMKDSRLLLLSLEMQKVLI